MNRRRFLLAASSLLAAPAIVRVASLMPVSADLHLRFGIRRLIIPLQLSGWTVPFSTEWPSEPA